MKLIDLSLVLILASYSEGQSWGINVQNKYEVTPGSDLTINCSFTYPPDQHITNLTVYWKIPGKKKCSWYDHDTRTFIYHKLEECVEEKYRKRTRLLGNASSNNCSLEILNITENVKELFVRVYAREPYSYVQEHQLVSISLKDATLVTENPESSSHPSFTVGATTINASTVPERKDTTSWMYPAIFVPVSVLLIVLLVAGIFFCMRHKRSQSFTRKESGYYANFSRASDPPKREVSDKKDKELPDLKAIDEPVYINTEEPTYEMDQSMDITDNVYANVDYTK